MGHIKNVNTFYCRASGSCEINNKKQSETDREKLSKVEKA